MQDMGFVSILMNEKKISLQIFADNFGITPLFEALRAGHDSVIQILVESGAKTQLEVRNLLFKIFY